MSGMQLMRRVLGVDFGQARIGVAISDELGMLAHPVETIPGGRVDVAAKRTSVDDVPTGGVLDGRTGWRDDGGHTRGTRTQPRLARSRATRAGRAASAPGRPQAARRHPHPPACEARRQRH